MRRGARVSVLCLALSLVACSPRSEPASSVDAGGGQGDEPDVVASGSDCEDDSDCSYNGICEAGACVDATCEDGVQNGDETDAFDVENDVFDVAVP